MPVTVAKSYQANKQIYNCGMQDITFTAVDGEAGVNPKNKSIGTTLQIKGLHNGYFKNIDIASFRSIAFGTTYSTMITFENCKAQNAQNCGGGGAGYGFYIRGQNMLYKNCYAYKVRHGYTTASPQTSNIVIKDCVSDSYTLNPETFKDEAIDDTHVKYSHGILYDNHYANKAGLVNTNRGTESTLAYETCGWSIVWNYKNEGYNTKDPDPNDPNKFANDNARNLLGITPAEYGIVVGAHAGSGPDGIRVQDGYSRYPVKTSGQTVTDPSLHVGSNSNRVLFEGVGKRELHSLYDIMFSKRAKLTH